MEMRVSGTVNNLFQYFLSDSYWDWHPVNDLIVQDNDKLACGYDVSALHIDKTGLHKKCKNSDGVAW